MSSGSSKEFPARFGKYILLDRINAGGMAEVFRGKVTGVQEFQRLVAIKCMLPGLHQDEQFVNMFVDEAKLSSQLSHANIVQIYELGSIEGQLFIAMELVNGRDLRHIIRTAKRKDVTVPMGFAVYVASKAAEALDFAHHKAGVMGEPLNLVHRDVSPQNILISYDGEVKVADFGIAKAEERATETRAGVLKGKFAYMSPEQVMGQPLDGRADIFALGSVLYETITGRKLFSGENDLSVLDRIRNAAVPEFESALSGAPGEVIQALVRSLQRERENRFPRAADFAESLEPVLIHDRKIFGAKMARDFMQNLFAGEIDDLKERMRSYITVTEADCPRETFMVETPEERIFESTFSGTDFPSEAGAQDRQGAPAAPIDLDRSGPAPSGPVPPGPSPPLGTAEVDATGVGRKSRPLSGVKTASSDQGGEPAVPSNRAGAGSDAEPSRRAPPDGATRNVAMDGARPGGRSRADDVANAEAGDGAGSEYFDEMGLDPSGTMRPLPPTTIGDQLLAQTAERQTKLSLPTPVVYASIGMAAIMLALLVLVLVNPWSGDSPAETKITELNTDQDEVQHPSTGPSDTTQEVPLANGPASTPDEPRFGYLSIKATGAPKIRVYLDQQKLGRAPQNRVRVAVGTHTVTIVEQKRGRVSGRSKTVEVVVTEQDTRKQPKRLQLQLGRSDTAPAADR